MRATAGQPTVERAPKQAHGAPARPRRIAPTIAAANIAISAAAPVGGGRAGDDARGEPELGADQRRPGDRLRSARSSIPNVASAARLERGLASFATLAARQHAAPERVGDHASITRRDATSGGPRVELGRQPIATMRSIGTSRRSAIVAGTLTSDSSSRSESRSFGSVIIFMYLQKAIRLASIRFACGAACWSG